MKIITNGEVQEPFVDDRKTLEPGAAERVEKFLDIRKAMIGLDPGEVAAVGSEDGIHPLMVADLRELIADAREFYATRAV